MMTEEVTCCRWYTIYSVQ